MSSIWPRCEFCEALDLCYLCGVWSRMSLCMGLAGAWLSFLSYRKRFVPHVQEVAMRIIPALPWIMAAWAFFLLNIALPGLQAYEGPPKLSRYITPYDILFASFISFAFGFVFALGALRFVEFRRRVLTWICIIAYVYVTPGWVEKLTRYLR